MKDEEFLKLLKEDHLKHGGVDLSQILETKEYLIVENGMLRDQINKMKSCFNCKHLVEYMGCKVGSCIIGFKNDADAKDKWELKD